MNGFTDEHADELGRMADSLDACLYSAKMPIPDSIHVTGLTGIVREARDCIAKIVREATGEDPWKTNPLEG